MTVSLRTDVTDEAGPELERLAARIGSLAPLFDEIGGALVASTQQRFVDQESPDGDMWAEHSPATVERRGPGADVLRQDNHLFDTIDHQAEAEGVVIGVNRVYSRVHQLGGEAGRGRKVHIPARPFLGVSEDDVEEIRALVQDHLEAS